jgi:hypothetical protein
MSRRGRVVCRAPHDDALAVAAGDQDRAFGRRVRPGPVLPEVPDVLGHLLVHLLQAVHRLLEAQHPGHGALGLPEGLLDAQPLVPVLQDVGEGRRRQLQPVVQGDELQLLPLAAAVGGAPQGERAEDGDVAAGVQFRQALADLPVGQGDGFAQVAAALQGEEVSQGGVPEVEQALPETAFDFVDGSPLHGGGADVSEQRAGQVVEQQGVVARQVVCEHGPRPPWRANMELWLSMLSSRRPVLSSAGRRNYLTDQGLAESGRPVTPECLEPNRFVAG